MTTMISDVTRMSTSSPSRSGTEILLTCKKPGVPWHMQIVDAVLGVFRSLRKRLFSRAAPVTMTLTCGAAEVKHFEIIDSDELAARLKVPASWIRSHTRANCPEELRIPVMRLGRYCRFRWGSPELIAWIEARCK